MDVAFFAGVEVSKVLREEPQQFNTTTAMNIFTIFFIINVGIISYKINVEKSKSSSQQLNIARNPKTGLPKINMAPMTISLRQMIVAIVFIVVFVSFPQLAIENGLLNPELLLESPWMSHLCSFLILFNFQVTILIFVPFVVLCSNKKLRIFAKKVLF